VTVEPLTLTILESFWKGLLSPITCIASFYESVSPLG